MVRARFVRSRPPAPPPHLPERCRGEFSPVLRFDPTLKDIYQQSAAEVVGSPVAFRSAAHLGGSTFGARVAPPEAICRWEGSPFPRASSRLQREKKSVAKGAGSAAMTVVHESWRGHGGCCGRQARRQGGSGVGTCFSLSFPSFSRGMQARQRAFGAGCNRLAIR